MARLNINILGIREPKWMRIGEFNSDDYYIYYCGQDPLEEMEKPSLSTEEFKRWLFGCNLKKWQHDLGSFQSKPFNITVIQV